MPAKVLDKMIASIPMGRMGEPHEIAETVAARAPDVRVTFSSRRTTAMWQRLLAGQRNPECISGRVGRT